MKKFWMFSFAVVAAAALILAGCGEQRRIAENEELVEPRKLTNIQADSVVNFYAADGSQYISTQQHSICPEVDTILISANEPQGPFGWKLAGAEFNLVVGQERLGQLGYTICDRGMSLVILTCVQSAMNCTVGEAIHEPVRIQGQWYQPLQVIDEPVKWAKRVLYSNVDSSVIDRVSIEDVKAGRILVGRCYNYRWIKEIGCSLPMTIDIFEANAIQMVSQRIARINYQQTDILCFDNR